MMGGAGDDGLLSFGNWGLIHGMHVIVKGNPGLPRKTNLYLIVFVQ